MPNQDEVEVERPRRGRRPGGRNRGRGRRRVRNNEVFF